MQFYLNGYKPGDPFVEEPHPSVGGIWMAFDQSQRLELVDDTAKRDRLDLPGIEGSVDIAMD